MRIIYCLFLFSLFSCMSKPTPASYTSFDEYPAYDGEDLGLTYSKGQSVFKVWAPAAAAMRLQLFDKALGGEPSKTIDMEYTEDDLWLAKVNDDLLRKFYAFSAKYGEQWNEAVPDPYARAVGTNGKRAQVIDLTSTNPAGWAEDRRPVIKSPTDIIIYELHIRDLSIHPNSDISHQGKFLGLTEEGTRSPKGMTTGLDHLKELGITHLHILPSYDFMSIDESKPNEPQFNWGYDPHNYNVPEGSYSTNPAEGATRIKEFKQMVLKLHQSGIRVVMDVVYNHTGQTEESIFNQLVPGYYYRHNADSTFANASACGNETSSDRAMTRKMILESVKYWVNEYHIDGFRFDLMGIHDIETMNIISEELHKIDPSIFIYGEGWTAGDSPLPLEKRALKHHVPQLKNIAAFSDDLRDGLKGSVFEHKEKGFVSGKVGNEESIKFGIVAATQHPQVNYEKVNYSKAFWAPEPSQCINYVSCHDNHTLFDRLKISNPEASEAEIERMHRLAQTIVLTSQGVAFLHAGTDFLRTKKGEENSYKSSDAINQLDWIRKEENLESFKYYQQLIALRKKHPAFRLPTTASIVKNLQFVENLPEQLVAYTLDGTEVGDSWKNIFVVFNGKNKSQSIALPDGQWMPVLDGKNINERGVARQAAGNVSIAAQTPMIFIKM